LGGGADVLRRPFDLPGSAASRFPLGLIGQSAIKPLLDNVERAFAPGAARDIVTQALLYWAAPNVKQPGFRWVTPGCVIAAQPAVRRSQERG
jgi:uncharacterized BrkB/YihY/UPF0761 family membrane protein